MSSSEATAELEDLQRAFDTAGYKCTVTSVGRFPRVLLAESPYGLVGVTESETWEGLEEVAADLQAELTHMSGREETIADRWDLYVLIHVRIVGLNSVRDDLLERIEGDTRYARKFIRVNLKRDSSTIDQALRPFLPLRSSPELEAIDTNDLLSQELIELGVDRHVVARVLSDYASTGKVDLE